MAYFWKYIYDSNIKGGSIECIDNWYKNNQIKATENLNEVPQTKKNLFIKRHYLTSIKVMREG